MAKYFVSMCSDLGGRELIKMLVPHQNVQYILRTEVTFFERKVKEKYLLTAHVIIFLLLKLFSRSFL